MEEEHPAPDPASPADGDRLRRIASWLVRFGNLLAAQAVPLVIGLASFIIAVDAWWSAKAVEWENDRALASLRFRSHYVDTGPDRRTVVTTLRVTNVGSLSFALLDVKLTLSALDGLSPAWDENSLLQPQAPLPLGITLLRRDKGEVPSTATFAMDPDTKTWHLVDPGRSVEMTFAQPVRGAGSLSIRADLYSQPISLADAVEAITVGQTIRGVVRPTLPEFGDGEISDAAIFPYSGTHLLLVSPPALPPPAGPMPR